MVPDISTAAAAAPSASCSRADDPDSSSNSSNARRNRNGLPRGQRDQKKSTYHSQDKKFDFSPNEDISKPATSNLKSSNSAQRTTRRPRPAVQRPRPKSLEKLGARMVELRQLETYLKPNFSKLSETSWKCKLKPSDPDFAFDIDSLEFTLTVPLEYPKSIPYLIVENSDIPKGYTINVERGFASICQNVLGKGRLLDMVLEFDKKLEGFLQQEKGETIKIVKYVPKKLVSAASSSGPRSNSVSAGAANNKPLHYNPSPKIFIPTHIREETIQQINLLITRLKGNAFIESESDMESVINIKITPSHSEILPEQLNATFKVFLYVPKNYGIAPCRLKVPLAIPEARNIEANFDSHARRAKSWSLIALMNFLTVELETLMVHDDYLKEKESTGMVVKEQQQDKKENGTGITGDTVKAGEMEIRHNSEIFLPDKGEEAEPKSESDSEGDREEHEEIVPETNCNEREFNSLKPSGTSLTFTLLDLENISLLECHSLHLQVECARCKTRGDMHLVSGPYGRESKANTTLCARCNNVMAAAFRKNLMFSSSPIVGYVDLAGCKADDYLPSLFFATCSECSTTSTENAFKRIELGKKTAANCRECHTKMGVTIRGFMFDVVSAEALAKEKINSDAAKLKARGRENLNITGGRPLPNHGVCEHYKKSNRWFRFSCCARVFACDRCHDAESNHPNERANRMICGFCSREQNFAVACTFCKHSFEHKFSPFWEGGKGTRDKARMSRKDKRKYQHRGASE